MFITLFEISESLTNLYLLSEVQDSGVRIYVVWPMQGSRVNDPSHFTYLNADAVLLKMEWNG
jgi:hypothetical protein